MKSSHTYCSIRQELRDHFSEFSIEERHGKAKPSQTCSISTKL